MRMETNQKVFVKWLLIFFAVLIFVSIICIWVGCSCFTESSGRKIEIDFFTKIIVTIIGIVVILIGYWQYNHQKKLDMKT